MEGCVKWKKDFDHLTDNQRVLVSKVKSLEKELSVNNRSLSPDNNIRDQILVGLK